MKTTFKQVIRDCPYNERIKSRADNTSGFIYDFEVWIDGVHRATWRRHSAIGRGYDLHDPDGRLIKGRADHRSALSAASKAQFGDLITKHIERIPDGQRLGELRQNDAEEKRRRSAHQLQDDINRTKAQAADLMFIALTKVAEFYGWSNKPTDGLGPVARLAVDALDAATFKPSTGDDDNG